MITAYLVTSVIIGLIGFGTYLNIIGKEKIIKVTPGFIILRLIILCWTCYVAYLWFTYHCNQGEG